MWQSNQFFVILLTFELFLYPLSTLPQPQEEASRGRAALAGGRRLRAFAPARPPLHVFVVGGGGYGGGTSIAPLREGRTGARGASVPPPR